MAFIFFLALFGLQGGLVEGVLKVGVSKLLSELVPDFISLNNAGECVTSFECDLITKICEGLNEECEIVVLQDLGDRLDGVQRGDVDMSVSLISVNPERAELVHFVRPYYYYSGAHIYTLATTPSSSHPKWSDLSNTKVCMLEDYYARSGVEHVYNPIVVEVPTTNSSLILDGVCKYIVTENTNVQEGITGSINALVEFGAPYGIAVAHDQRDSLGARVGEVLVDLMDDGLDSEILKIENSTLVASGHAQNVKLLDVVLAITKAGGAIEPLTEDAIWDE